MNPSNPKSFMVKCEEVCITFATVKVIHRRQHHVRRLVLWHIESLSSFLNSNAIVILPINKETPSDLLPRPGWELGIGWLLSFVIIRPSQRPQSPDHHSTQDAP